MLNYKSTGTTTSLIRHLENSHEIGWGEFQEKKRKRDGDKTVARKKPKTEISASKKREINRELMVYMALDMQPFSTVEGKGFRSLLRTLVPGYTPPHRTTFSRSLGPDLYQEVKDKLKEAMAEDTQQGLMSISCTTDGWTSRTRHDYLSLTVHYVTAAFDLKNVTIGVKLIDKDHTGLNLKLCLEELLSEWNLLNLPHVPTFFATDNALNIGSAVRLGNWSHILCFAHTLQLALKDAKKFTPGVTDLLTKVKFGSLY